MIFDEVEETKKQESIHCIFTVAGPAHAADEDAAPNRAEISSACVTEVTPPTTPDDSQSSASNQNAPSNANNRRNAAGGQGSARGSEGPGPVDEESTMSADSSDSARPSAVEREREKVRLAESVPFPED